MKAKLENSWQNHECVRHVGPSGNWKLQMLWSKCRIISFNHTPLPQKESQRWCTYSDKLQNELILSTLAERNLFSETTGCKNGVPFLTETHRIFFFFGCFIDSFLSSFPKNTLFDTLSDTVMMESFKNHCCSYCTEWK